MDAPLVSSHVIVRLALLAVVGSLGFSCANGDTGVIDLLPSTLGANGPAVTPCASDAECSRPTPYCHLDRYVCVECLDHPNCTSGKEILCDPASSVCVQCLADTDCSGSYPFCNTSTKKCVECLEAAHCASADDVCNTFKGSCVPRCASSGECSAPTLYCDVGRELCVECVGDTNCVDERKPNCRPSDGRCVECVEDADCTRDERKPLCDVARGYCVEPAMLPTPP